MQLIITCEHILRNVFSKNSINFDYHVALWELMIILYVFCWFLDTIIVITLRYAYSNHNYSCIKLESIIVWCEQLVQYFISIMCITLTVYHFNSCDCFVIWLSLQKLASDDSKQWNETRLQDEMLKWLNWKHVKVCRVDTLLLRQAETSTEKAIIRFRFLEP